MSAETIPNEIIEAAEECVIHLPEIAGPTRVILRGLISKAIHEAVMAERERCAGIAEDTGRSYCSYSEHSDGAGYYACGEAAAAIRNNSPPKQSSLPINDDDLPF